MKRVEFEEALSGLFELFRIQGMDEFAFNYGNILMYDGTADKQ